MAFKKLSLSVALAATSLSLIPVGLAHAEPGDPNPLGAYCYQNGGGRFFSTTDWSNFTDLATYQFKLTDGSTTAVLPYQGEGLRYSSLDLPVGVTYQDVILTYQDGSTKTFSVQDPTDSNGCRATVLPPKAVQKANCGANNDDFTLDPSLPVLDDSGWQEGKRTITVGNSSSLPERQEGIPIYAFKDSGQEGAMITYTLTDDEAACASTKTVQVPVTTTVREAYTAYRDVPVYKTVVSNPTVTVQVDQYLPIHRKGYWLNGKKLAANQALTPWERTVLARLDDDNQLGYDEDHFMWGGASNSKIITLSAQDIQNAGGFDKAVKNKTGWLPTSNYSGAQVPAGATVVKAWVLGNGATAAAPWGPKHNISQKDFDAATPKVTTTKVKTGTTKEAYTAYRDVTKTTMVDKTVTVPGVPPAFTVTARSNNAF